jgi:hypothetical protein
MNLMKHRQFIRKIGEGPEFEFRSVIVPTLDWSSDQSRMGHPDLLQGLEGEGLLKGQITRGCAYSEDVLAGDEFP